MLLVLSSYYFTLSRSHIAKLAIQQRLPTMFCQEAAARALRAAMPLRCQARL
jgi:hypothetical protein